jgi:hypothetical protein
MNSKPRIWFQNGGWHCGLKKSAGVGVGCETPQIAYEHHMYRMWRGGMTMTRLWRSIFVQDFSVNGGVGK